MALFGIGAHLPSHYASCSIMPVIEKRDWRQNLLAGKTLYLSPALEHWEQKDAITVFPAECQPTDKVVLSIPTMQKKK